jgi:hypothetical protein
MAAQDWIVGRFTMTLERKPVFYARVIDPGHVGTEKELRPLPVDSVFWNSSLSTPSLR